MVITQVYVYKNLPLEIAEVSGFIVYMLHLNFLKRRKKRRRKRWRKRRRKQLLLLLIFWFVQLF